VSDCVQMLTDPRIPTLSEVLDSAALAKHLHGVSLGPWNGAAIEEIEVRVLRHHAGQRCTLDIGLRTQSGWQFLIGKVYRGDRSEFFRSMEEVQQAGFGPHEEYSIPEPLAYVPSLRLILQEKVAGPVAEEIFLTGDEVDRAAAAKRSALWLARFHARAPRKGLVSTPDDYLNSKRMRKCGAEIAKLDESFARKADRLHQLLEGAASSLKAMGLCAGHGAFRADHVILCQGRTVIFDFDTQDVTDPARDVARFLVALRRLALDLGSIRAMDEPYDVFLKTYLAVGQPGVERNLRVFEGAAYFKRAKRLLARQAPRWRENTEAMLDEGIRVLEREVA
jgi:aminoglycoside phosphotransferase (APT) family kinase protein